MSEEQTWEMVNAEHEPNTNQSSELVENHTLLDKTIYSRNSILGGVFDQLMEKIPLRMGAIPFEISYHTDIPLLQNRTLLQGLPRLCDSPVPGWTRGANPYVMNVIMSRNGFVVSTSRIVPVFMDINQTFTQSQKLVYVGFRKNEQNRLDAWMELYVMVTEVKTVSGDTIFWAHHQDLLFLNARLDLPTHEIKPKMHTNSVSIMQWKGLTSWEDTNIVRVVYSYTQVHTAIFLRAYVLVTVELNDVWYICLRKVFCTGQPTLEMNFIITQDQLQLDNNKSVWISYINKEDDYVKFPVTYMHDFTLDQLGSLNRENIMYECFA